MIHFGEFAAVAVAVAVVSAISAVATESVLSLGCVSSDHSQFQPMCQGHVDLPWTAESMGLDCSLLSLALELANGNSSRV